MRFNFVLALGLMLTLSPLTHADCGGDAGLETQKNAAFAEKNAAQSDFDLMNNSESATAAELTRLQGILDGKSRAFSAAERACNENETACARAAQLVSECSQKSNEGRSICENPDRLQRKLDDEVTRLKDAYKTADSSFQCSKDLLGKFKEKTKDFADNTIRSCREKANACRSKCEAADAALRSCTSGAALQAALAAPVAVCQDVLKSPKRIDQQLGRFHALLDRQIQQLSSGTGATSENAELGAACVATKDDPPSPSPGGGDKANEPTKKNADNKNAMSGLASALGPMMNALANQAAQPTVPPVATSTLNDQDCSLAQNANNPTCICAVNPRFAGCQLALQGSNGNPVQFGAVNGYGGANLEKDTASAANSLDLASQRFEMPPINPNANAASAAPAGFLGGGSTSLGGGGLGSANNSTDDSGAHRRGAALSAQILGGSTSTSSSLGSRGLGMAFIDRDGGTSYRRGSSWDKIDVAAAAASQPDLRQFAPDRVTAPSVGTWNSRRIAGLEDPATMHTADKIIFNEVHSTYQRLSETLEP